MTAALDVSVDLIDVLRAPLAVTCPKCAARPAHECESTGGGNRAHVTTHKARELRVTGWNDVFAAEAGRLVRQVFRKSWEDRAAVDWSQFEQSAAPITATTAPAGPASVRLSEKQASRIELAAQDGVLHAPTSHFHGDADRRKTINALEVKGIVEQFDTTPDGYDRLMRLTAFGWLVYRQHPKVIRRLDEADIARGEAHRDGQPDVPTCGHCSRPQRGFAKAASQPLCHPEPGDGVDCYTRVTVLQHPTPCTACADTGEGGS